jgi:hypothetical protein
MEKNQYNKEGNREGYWEGKYMDGRRAYRGYFRNHFRIGLWEFLNEENLIATKIFYYK